LADIGARLGISEAAISRKFKQWTANLATQDEPMRANKLIAPDAGVASAIPAPTPRAATVPLPEFTSEDAVAVAKSACVGVLVQTHALLVAPASIGPSGLKAAAAAIKDSVDMLARLGVLDLAEIAAVKPQEIVIRRLTEAEEVEIQAAAEAGDSGGEGDESAGEPSTPSETQDAARL
jgi:hypothetical protein